MTAIADKPVRVKPGGTVQYTITQKDQDVGNNDGVLALVPDTSSQIRPTSIFSMGPFEFNARGLQSDGTVLWDVIGTATEQPGVYHDTWLVFNNRFQLDLGFDAPLSVSQTVIVDPAA